MTRHRGLAAFAFVTLVALTGCGDSSSSTNAASTPSPSAWTVAQACFHWETAAAPAVAAVNATTAARVKQQDGATSWTKVRDTTGRLATEARTFVTTLESPPQPWPTPLAQAVPLVPDFWKRTAVWAAGVDRATSETEFTAAWGEGGPVLEDLPSDLEAAYTVVSEACGA